MPNQTNKKFIHLSNQPALKLETLKQQTVLSIKQTEKAIADLKEKLTLAENFLATHSGISAKIRQKLENSVQEGTRDVALYEVEIIKIKQRLVSVMKQSDIL